MKLSELKKNAKALFFSEFFILSFLSFIFNLPVRAIKPCKMFFLFSSFALLHSEKAYAFFPKRSIRNKN